MSIKAIQMIGTQRSGSNLLRVMLNQLPEIYAPHPPHILMVFYPLLMHYGDLNQNRNFELLAKDVCKYIELNPVPWANAELDSEKIIGTCQRHTLLELFIRINEWQCIRNKKTFWCCKSLETIYYIENFQKEDFHPFVIYLVRDGRDVAASFKKVMIGEKHIYHLASKWKKEQELAFKYIDALAHASERYILLKYEDLIADPAKYLKEICGKLGLNYSASMLNYYASDESQRTAEAGQMWGNVTKPLLKDNTRNFLNVLNKEEIEIFEAVAGEMLDRLGYSRTSPAQSLNFSPEQLAAFDAQNESMKKAAINQATEHDKQKRKPQKDFIEQLTKRIVV